MYTGSVTADDVICALFDQVIAHYLDRGAIDKWYFVRYADPHWHLRVRMHGKPEALLEQVVPEMCATSQKVLEKRRLWRVRIDTYEREVQRYGGENGISLAEDIFYFDSMAVLEIVKNLGGDDGAGFRWRLGLLSISLLLHDFGMNLKEKLDFVAMMRQGLGQEYKEDSALRIQLGGKYRNERSSIEAIMDESSYNSAPLRTCLAALRKRSERAVRTLQQFMDHGYDRTLRCSLKQLVANVVHMHVNRLLQSSQRFQEYILYDFLRRFFISQVKKSGPV